MARRCRGPVRSRGELRCSGLRKVSGPTGPACARPRKARSPADIFALLTYEPNAEVGRVHAKAKAVILTTTAVARCYDDCGQVKRFLQRGQTGVVLERWRWETRRGREIN